MVKVSVVVPICNVEKYLRQCLDSIANQTLKDIEVILVNDGSKDSSGAICDEYVAKDPRFRVIHKVNTGYGNSMNIGVAACTGEYIGIIESDDYAELDMFEQLYATAKQQNCEVVKSNFYEYFSSIEEETRFFENYSRRLCGTVFSPSKDLKMHDQIAFWNAKPSIWSGLYLRSFIEENHITFNETPGASYQDTSFLFKVWGCAERVYVMYPAFLHYRQDSTGSSVNNTGKIYCVCDEYAEIERFIEEKEERAVLYPLMNRIKLDTYLWNISRIADQFVPEFVLRAAEEFTESARKGQIDKKMYDSWKWDSLLRLSRFPRDFAHQMIAEKDARITSQRLDRMQGQLDAIQSAIGCSNAAQAAAVPTVEIRKRGLGAKIRTAARIFGSEGFSGVLRVIKEKLSR